MKQANFPLKVRMSAAALTELHSCEFGSYEDHIGRDGTREGEYADGRLHCVELIERGRYKTVVVLKTQMELDEFFCSSMTGTWGLYHLRTVLRVYDELFDYVSDYRKANITRGSLGY